MVGLWHRAEIRIRTHVLNVGFSDRVLAAQDLQQGVFLEYRAIDDLVEFRLLILNLRQSRPRRCGKKNHRKIYFHFLKPQVSSNKIWTIPVTSTGLPLRVAG